MENAYQLGYVNRPLVHWSHLNLSGFNDLQIIVERYNGGT